MEAAIRGRPHHRRGLLPLQAFLEEVRGWLLLLGSMREEEDNDDEIFLLLRGLEGEELLGRGEFQQLQFCRRSPASPEVLQCSVSIEL